MGSLIITYLIVIYLIFLVFLINMNHQYTIFFKLYEYTDHTKNIFKLLTNQFDNTESIYYLLQIIQLLSTLFFLVFLINMNHKCTNSLNFMSTHITLKYFQTFDKSDTLYYLYTNLQILNNLLQSMCDLLRLLYASLHAAPGMLYSSLTLLTYTLRDSLKI